MTTQSPAAVKAPFSKVTDEVAGTHERVTIMKNGRPVAPLDQQSGPESGAAIADLWPLSQAGKAGEDRRLSRATLVSVTIAVPSGSPPG